MNPNTFSHPELEAHIVSTETAWVRVIKHTSHVSEVSPFQQWWWPFLSEVKHSEAPEAPLPNTGGKPFPD